MCRHRICGQSKYGDRITLEDKEEERDFSSPEKDTGVQFINSEYASNCDDGNDGNDITIANININIHPLHRCDETGLLEMTSRASLSDYLSLIGCA